MDVWRLTVAALRRWYILLPLLALTGFGALQATQGIQPQYDVTATAMIVPGSTSAEIANPYGGLDDASQVVAIVLNSNETRAEIAAQGLNPAYEVAAESRTTIMHFSVTDLTPDGGIATLDAVLDAAALELETRQDEAGIPASAQYGITTIAAPAVSAVVEDGKTRIMAIVGVLGASVAFLAAVLFDDIIGLIKRRRRKRRERKAARLSSALQDETASVASGGDETAEKQPTATGNGVEQNLHERPDLEDADEQTPVGSGAAGGSIEAYFGSDPEQPDVAGESMTEERMVRAGRKV